MRIHALAIALAVAAAMAALPAASQASTAHTTGSVLHVDGSPGETNRLTVALSGSNAEITETGPGATLTAGAGCSPSGPNVLVCPAGGLASLSMDGGDGDDWLTNTAPGPSTLAGGIGDDILAGGPAADSLLGGAGNDLLDGAAQADTLSGGADTDTVSYSSRTNPVTAALGGGAGNGEAGENDTISTDVEALSGGSDDDTLTGGTTQNTLSGGDGADTLDGGAGDDLLDGGLGGDLISGGADTDTASYASSPLGVTVDLDDTADDGGFLELDNVHSDVENLTGGSGNDTLTGDAAANAFDGGGGDDTLTGDAGLDILSGGAGADSIFSRDSAVDTVNCGTDGDQATVDAGDTVAGDCEAVDDGSTPPPDPSPTPAPAPPPADPVDPVDPVDPEDPVANAAEREKIRIFRGAVTITGDGRAPIRVGCPAGRATPCRGSITIALLAPARKAGASRRSRPKRIGKRRFHVASGKTKLVGVRLSRHGRRRLLRSRQSCRVSVTLPGPDGKPIVSVQTLSLKPPPPDTSG